MVQFASEDTVDITLRDIKADLVLGSEETDGSISWTRAAWGNPMHLQF